MISRYPLFLCVFFGLHAISLSAQDLRLWYTKPAAVWTEALPIGNGRIGAMVFGGVQHDRIQFNEETLWTGMPREHDKKDAHLVLDSIRKLLFDGKQKEANALAEKRFMGQTAGHEARNEWLKKITEALPAGPSNMAYDDHAWDAVNIPMWDGWENHGLKDFDGAVWFRTKFQLPDNWRDEDLVIDLGYVKNLDYVYCNGKLIGSMESDGIRRYRISKELLHRGQNTLSVQVINFMNAGGICGYRDSDRSIGLYAADRDSVRIVSLAGPWKFKVHPSDPPPKIFYQASYQPFGDLWLHFRHPDSAGYQRDLNIQNAIASTRYKAAGVGYTREYFVSQPDQSLVIHLRSDKPAALSFDVEMQSPHRIHQLRDAGMQTLELTVQVNEGVLKGIAQLRIRSRDGSLRLADGRIQVTDATEATIYLSAGTTYQNYLSTNADPYVPIQKAWSSLARKSYQQVREDHVREYQSYFNTFSISLGSSANESLPTDKRIEAFPKSDDPSFVALYAQYGRYLLISSSRPGTGPANLQGIWNDLLSPPWGSKYTTNINAEMNYWPAEQLNLSPMHDALFSLIKDVSENGRNTAKAYYRAPGWVLHHNTDLWRGTAPINAANHGIWVTGGAWLCQHLWERYRFTQDTVFLRSQAYPIMKEAALFFEHFLIRDPVTGWLISTPSNSPEIGGLVAGPTMDHQIIRELFRNVTAASQILGVDSSLANRLASLIPRIAPNQIGRHGQLQEWLQDKDDPGNHHRHVSHLWAVYPGGEINWDASPAMMKAARQSLIYRGDAATGWSLGWKINFWARFKDGDHAYQLIRMLLGPANGGAGSYPNLFDAHPPFQIDGNFGGAAGIGELLIQSHLQYLDILPSLPAALPSGNVRGICARGGFVIDLDWKEGKLLRLTVRSRASAPLHIRYGQKTVDIRQVRPGQVFVFDGKLQQIL